MNANAVRDVVVYGRFRIPFPDTTYASPERRDEPSIASHAVATRSSAAIDTRETQAETQAEAPVETPCADRPAGDRRSLRCFVTAHVVASIENLCASELGAHIDSAGESVVGSEVLLKHNHPASAGSVVSVSGRVVQIEGRSVTFNVEAKVDNLLIADGQLRFVVVERGRFAAPRIESIVERALSSILGISSHAVEASAALSATSRKFMPPRQSHPSHDQEHQYGQ